MFVCCFLYSTFPYSLMQVAGDLDGLEQALGRKTLSKSFGTGSCSALVKLLPGNKDLLISHDTWGSYNTMLRLFKSYNFPFNRQSITGIRHKNLLNASYLGRLGLFAMLIMIESVRYMPEEKWGHGRWENRLSRCFHNLNRVEQMNKLHKSKYSEDLRGSMKTPTTHYVSSSLVCYVNLEQTTSSSRFTCI